MLVLGLAAVGCSHRVYSPPTRALPLDSATVLESGESSVALEAGAHGAYFGPDLSSIGGRVRVSVDGRWEATGEGTVLRVIDDEGVDTHPNIYALHGGVRYGAFRHLSLEAGGGFGVSAGGGFAAPALGATLAYENRWLVPFIALRGYASLPVYTRSVVLGEELDEDTDELETLRDRPKTTVGVQVGVGLRVPLRSDGQEQGSLHLGLGATEMADEDDRVTFSSAAIGLSLLL